MSEIEPASGTGAEDDGASLRVGSPSPTSEVLATVRGVMRPSNLLIAGGVVAFAFALAPSVLYREYPIESLLYVGAGATVGGLGLATVKSLVDVVQKQKDDDAAPGSLFGFVRIDNVRDADIRIQYPETIPPAYADSGMYQASAALRRQESILHSIYDQGLRQATISFAVSMVFACIGGFLLLLGVGLAIANATADGERYASIVAALSGTVVTLVSSLFFSQSNRTRRTMAEQGSLLREESQDDRRLSAARELAVSIEDPATKNDIKLRIADALIDNLRERPKRDTSDPAPSSGNSSS